MHASSSSATGPQKSVRPDGPLFQQVLEFLPLAAYTCDADGLITGFNRAAMELWGRAPRLNDPIDRYCGSVRLFQADGTPIEHSECSMALALKTQRAYEAEEIIIERPDGERASALAHAKPLVDVDGRVIGAVNILVNIPDRISAEESSRLLASIVENSGDAIVSKDLEGRIRTWNAGAEELFGYTAAEAVGRSITLIIPPKLHAEEAEILRRLRGGEAIRNYECSRLHKSGREIRVSLSISPVRDRQGHIVGAAKVARDITSQKQSRTELVALQEELTAQLADMQQLQRMSLQLSKTRELEPILQQTLSTACAISGAQHGLLSLYDAGHDELRVGASTGFDAAFLRGLEGVPAGTGACDICCATHARVVIEDVADDPNCEGLREAFEAAGIRSAHSTPLITRAGELVGALSVHFRTPHRPSDRELRMMDLCARQAVDFIENARLYAQLRDSDRRKDEFLAVLAHELRNPLAPLANSLHILRLSDELPPTIEALRGIMETQVQHLVRLVDDLLEVSRITRGKIELRQQDVELASVLSAAVETSRPHIDAAGQQLMIQVAAQPVLVHADPVRLTQVFTNLLNNATKYTPREGQIWLSAGIVDGRAEIIVRDNGAGIAAEMLPRIFDMFSQVEEARAQAQGGLGLGLAVSRGLIGMHGGTIDAHSDGLGCGSQFVVRLPIVFTASRPMVVAAAPKADLAPLPQRKILIVDDTRVAAFTLGRLLETLGQSVTLAYDGVSALQCARDSRPEIIISDIGMPEMDGYEFARQVRGLRELESAVLVALTGYGQADDRRRALDAGFRSHLIKPVSLQALHDLLATLASESARDAAPYGQPLSVS